MTEEQMAAIRLAHIDLVAMSTLVHSDRKALEELTEAAGQSARELEDYFTFIKRG